MRRALLPSISLTVALATSAVEARAEVDRAKLGHLVRQDCGSCHGLSLKGGLGRPLTREALADFPRDVVRDIILDGLPGTPMPPWRPLLRIEEAEAIADMLKSGETP
ncbi:MAG: cytochrome c [Rhodoblastus sp.]|nr:MAG: cytochrome c [Rhodoblastus sp.]